LAPVPLSGLASQTMLAEVEDPEAGAAALLLLLPPPPQAARVSTVKPARAVRPTPPFSRAGDLLKILRDIFLTPPGLCP
jgi:hypothetical protein